MGAEVGRTVPNSASHRGLSEPVGHRESFFRLGAEGRVRWGKGQGRDLEKRWFLVGVVSRVCRERSTNPDWFLLEGGVRSDFGSR